jgi:hypothetical protein
MKHSKARKNLHARPELQPRDLSKTTRIIIRTSPSTWDEDGDLEDEDCKLEEMGAEEAEDI